MNSALNVCVIDDDEIYQFTITKILKSIELAENITVFSDGEEAFDFLIDNLNNEKELPDVILLDINMPIMDGFQFMEEYIKIKPKVGKKITIYMVSSSVDPVDIDKAKSISEISDYIIKPVSPGLLRTILTELHDSGKI
ncbi:response regulator [Seonamhaeicola algicola]|uniref:Response regulator n=1 Tax=Seonamhaeicola algicola TaxID=1719036 RepID=A0A5C7AZJ0_9FLAO|nr:response regulator [Seonamhaeicola algicola]TXE13931.1 response regulator [Seonamhaeicola algicola]